MGDGVSDTQVRRCLLCKGEISNETAKEIAGKLLCFDETHQRPLNMDGSKPILEIRVYEKAGERYSIYIDGQCYEVWYDDDGHFESDADSGETEDLLKMVFDRATDNF